MEKKKSGFKNGIIIPTTALILGAIAFGGATEASAAEYTPETWEARSPEEIVIQDWSAYLIIWGDTLWAISEASGVSVDALVQINNIANRDLIYAGNTLVIDGKIVTVTEQNGVQTSFKVDGDMVTQTTNHAVADKKAPITTPKVEEKVAVDAEDKENFSAVETTPEAKPEVKDEIKDESKDDAKEGEDGYVSPEDGGNFRPVSPDEDVKDPVVETPKDITIIPVEPEEDEEPVFEPGDDAYDFVEPGYEDEVIDEPVEDEYEEPVFEEDEPWEKTSEPTLEMNRIISHIMMSYDPRFEIGVFEEVRYDDYNLMFFGATGNHGTFDDITELKAKTQAISEYLTKNKIKYIIDNGRDYSIVYAEI